MFRTYFTSGRGVEALGSVWTFLDLTPLGRQETLGGLTSPPAQTPRAGPRRTETLDAKRLSICSLTVTDRHCCPWRT